MKKGNEATFLCIKFAPEHPQYDDCMATFPFAEGEYMEAINDEYAVVRLNGDDTTAGQEQHLNSAPAVIEYSVGDTLLLEVAHNFDFSVFEGFPFDDNGGAPDGSGALLCNVEDIGPDERNRALEAGARLRAGYTAMRTKLAAFT